MAKRGRPPVLDEIKQREIVAIVSMGCSRRTAAQYVGCAPSTIQYTAERNEKFAEKLERAQSQAVVTHVKNINSAAKKAQYWRAAAWALERLDARGIRRAASRCHHRRTDIAAAGIFVANHRGGSAGQLSIAKIS